VRVTQPVTLQHRSLVPLVAAGLSSAVIAAEAGCAASVVDRVKRAPAFRALVHAYASASRRQFLDAVDTVLTRDALATLRFLQQVRDGKLRGQSADALRVRLQAASILFDRQVPKRTEVTEDKTIRLVIGREKRDELQALMAEALPALPGPAETVVEPSP